MDKQQYSFLNRDLSWLSFNYRVLLEAADEKVPLYNRIFFASVFSANLDEFFRVRMPSIYAISSLKAAKKTLRDEYPKDLLQQVKETLNWQLPEYGRVLEQLLLPALKKNHIHLYYGESILQQHKEILREYFLSKALSFIQPVILRNEKQQGIFLENNALYFIVSLESTDEPAIFLTALLNIPSDHLSRFLELPPIAGTHFIIFLDDVIREYLHETFPGFIIRGAWSVKLTRNAELNIGDEFIGDIAEKIEKQLEKRETGESTRFLFDKTMPQETRDFVKNYFDLRDDEMVPGGRYHNLKDLAKLPNPVAGKNSLTYPPWPALPHPGLSSHHSIFQGINEKEKLLHLPYHSYNYILRFFNEAAIDPQVKEIYITLYRVAADSHIANALISAAKNGKKVTVFVELKARFDEANNLQWSKKMKAAGVRITNSIPKLKVHAKVALIKKWINNQWLHYSFFSTGNFNEATGRHYTDHVFLTANTELGTELGWLFTYLQSRRQPSHYLSLPFRHLLVSKFNMIKRFNELIVREIEHARLGKPAGIIIKVNNLEERKMITQLYNAGCAGVKVELLVRSICCLAAAVPGQSENITVKRIIDRYLEHARVFVFHNNGQPEYYMGSADWMNRNLHNRIEVCFPVYDPQLQEEIRQMLEFQLNDDVKGAMLGADYENKRPAILPTGMSAQEMMYNYVKGL